MEVVMVMLTTRQQAVRSGRARRLVDVAAQQRVLGGMGVQVALDDLKGLPPGAWIRYLPEDMPLRLAQYIR
jgi:hypothetical protein